MGADSLKYGLGIRLIRAKKEPGSLLREPGIYLATTYSHRTYRPTTIGAAAFHFRVRNGTGWFHRAVVTRGQFQLQSALFRAGLIWNWDSGGLRAKELLVNGKSLLVKIHHPLLTIYH